MTILKSSVMYYCHKQEKGTFDKKHKKNIFYSLSNEKELE